MAPAFVLVDVECKVIARLASDKRRRFGARGRTRPTCTGLNSRFAIGRSQAKIDFVGRPPFERRVGTVFVVPIDERKKLPTTCFSTAGNQNSSSALVLHGLAHTFNHGEPTAPYRGGWMPLRLTQRRKAPQSKILSRSQTMYFGAALTRWIVRPKNAHTARQSGRLVKTPT